MPVIVKELSDAESLEIAIIENVQRADLNAVEEAAGYERLMQQFEYTQDKLSKLIGKSRSHVANTLRLLSLPDGVRGLIEEGKLTAGQARPLIGHDDAEKFAREIVARGLSAREAEALTRKPDPAAASTKPKSLPKAEKRRRHAGARKEHLRPARPPGSRSPIRATRAARSASPTRRSSSSTRSAAASCEPHRPEDALSISSGYG